MPYYEKASNDVSAWKRELLDNNHYELFDLYLFYSQEFQFASYNTLEEIEEVRNELQKYSIEAQNSAYNTLILSALERQKLSAIGAVAPEVTGIAPSGEEISLSGFRGKYVLLDFWSSGCSWCRAETPNLRKTYEAFQDKGFTILGISTDFSKDDWLRAIEEDGATWDHLLLQKKNSRQVLANYNILGIPKIVLVDPEGKILEKDMRGEEIYNAVAKHIAL